MIPIRNSNISTTNIACNCTGSGVRISIQPLHLMTINTITMRLMGLYWQAYLRRNLWSTTLTKILAACIAVIEPILTCNITSTIITCYCYCSWVGIFIAPSHRMSIVAHHRGRIYLYWRLRKNLISLA